MIDRLEDRRLSSADATAAVQSPEPIPHVVGVFVSSTRWTDAFKQHIARPAGAAGDAAGVGVGISLYGPEVGWTNLDQIVIQFDRAVTADASDLRVRGLNVAQYPVVSFRTEFNPLLFETVATWTLARPLVNDKILLELNGDAPDGVRLDNGPNAPPEYLDGDNDGTPGGDMRTRFDVLPGDGGGSRSVTWGDVSATRYCLNTSVDNPGAGPSSYSVETDINGDGRINTTDLGEVRRRIGTASPDGNWYLTAAASTSPLRIRPVTRGLFSSAAVLA